MEVIQVANLMNGITKELLGDTAVVNEDLSNVVDIGKTIFDNVSYDKYVRTLVDHIGKVVFQDRVYEGAMSSLYRDSWEYGAVMEKIYPTGLPEAVENESWELTDGTSYDPNVFHKPEVAAKFYNKKTTLEIDLSIADKQCRGSFSNGAQLNNFVTMLKNNIDNSLKVKHEALAQRTINNLIVSTIAAEFPSVSNNDYSSSTGVKAINLLKLYNDQFSPATNLTAANCMFSAEFIRFASFIISRTMKRMKKISTLFNIGGIPNFAPTSKQHLILLSDFKSAADMYLQSDTFNQQFTALPMAEDVPYWQGTGTSYDDASVATIHAEVVNGDSTKEITLARVFGVAFDHDGAGITNDERRVTSNYNGKAEFTNYFFKQDCSYFNDFNCPAVVFFAS